MSGSRTERPEPKAPQLRPQTGMSGVLLASAPIPFGVAAWAQDGVDARAPLWVLVVMIVAVLALLAGGLVVPFRARLGRGLAAAGAIGPLAVASPRLVESPALTLVALLGTAGALALLGNLGGSLLEVSARRAPLRAGRVRSAAITALAFWSIAGLASGTRGPAEIAAVGASMLVTAALGVGWALVAWHRTPIRVAIHIAGFVTAAALAAAHHGDLAAIVGSLGVYAAIAAALGTDPHGTMMVRRWATLLEHPARLFVGTFALLSLLGALVLAQPQSASAGVGIGFLDALFTSVSAVCITGLTVRDTASAFSGLGLGTILLLMQLGGLGIMTFSTAAIRLLGQRMSMRQEAAVASLIGTRDRGRLIESAQTILKLTFASELCGALLLIPAFAAHGDAIGTAIWRATFTSVSAFCNAGFVLQSTSLIPYQSDPAILHVVGTLILLGSLSPIAVLTIPALVFRRNRGIAAQPKLALAVAGVLLVLGFVLVLATEWDHVLAGMSIPDKLHNAWFQSLTLRSAGFNSIDIAEVRPATLAIMMPFMFIGGSPGGTAGGIRTTTAAVLALAVVQAVLGRPAIVVFGRRIGGHTVVRAAVVMTVAVTALVVASVAILITQPIPMPVALFEVVSALGTVGLSAGATATLDELGKVVILVCMFVGRVGGVTLLMVMSQRTPPAAIDRPEEEIDVG